MQRESIVFTILMWKKRWDALFKCNCMAGIYMLDFCIVSALTWFMVVHAILVSDVVCKTIEKWILCWFFHFCIPISDVQRRLKYTLDQFYTAATLGAYFLELNNSSIYVLVGWKNLSSILSNWITCNQIAIFVVIQ